MARPHALLRFLLAALNFRPNATYNNFKTFNVLETIRSVVGRTLVSMIDYGTMSWIEDSLAR